MKRRWFGTKTRTFQPSGFARFLATACAQVTDSFSAAGRFQTRSFWFLQLLKCKTCSSAGCWGSGCPAKPPLSDQKLLFRSTSREGRLWQLLACCPTPAVTKISANTTDLAPWTPLRSPWHSRDADWAAASWETPAFSPQTEKLGHWRTHTARARVTGHLKTRTTARFSLWWSPAHQSLSFCRNASAKFWKNASPCPQLWKCSIGKSSQSDMQT